VQAAKFGDSDGLKKGSPVLVASIGAQPLTAAYVVDRRAYAGSWEYLLENAIYTAPVHPNFGGAALVGPEGQLLGIGSLMVNVSDGFHAPLPGNIFIPINLLKPILDDLVRNGRAGGRTNPWLGIYTAEHAGRVVIQRLAPEGPGERAGLQAGDLIVGVSGKRVGDMTAFLRQVWTAGRAGDPIPLDILRPARGTLDIDRVMVNSISRYDWQRRAQPR
jgi:S1-C subfamily serine protease